MPIRLTTILLTLLCGLSTLAQNYQDSFAHYTRLGDTAAQRVILQAWHDSDSKDAELYPAYFNYYYSKSKQETIVLRSGEAQGDAFIIKDSTGNQAGYISAEITYQDYYLELGLEKIDQGIALFPNRLDMRFGKIYVLGLTEQWERFTEEIKKTIRYSAQNNNAWTWTNHEPREDAANFFLSSLQDYQMTLYNTYDDSLLYNMRDIAMEVVKYYPDHIVSLSNIGLTYSILGDDNHALEYFLKALAFDQTDVVILNNLALTYKKLNDIENARLYYTKMIEHGTARDQEYAQDQLEQLKD